MESKNALAMIFARNGFYRRLYLVALAAFGVSVVLITMLALILYYIVKNPPHPLYFATDDVSRLLELIPLDQPNMSTDEVSDWAVSSVEAAYTYDYVNYRAELQDAQKYFTTAGWRDYMKALDLSKNLLALTERRMIVSAHAIEKPKLIKEGVLQTLRDGVYVPCRAYRFQMPVLVTYWLPPYNAKSKFSNALTVEVVVQRQPILQSYKGLGVLQIIASS
jgi:intracellular multiplication protein IcmL